MNEFHTSVLLQEVVESLNVRSGAKYIDATAGGGGHSLEILRHGGIVLGIDQDEEALEFIKESVKGNLTLVHGNFRDLRQIAKENGFGKVAGILFDLGVSSHQFDDGKRGFSFKQDAPLDMRMDKSQSTTAADILNTWPKEALYEKFKEIGQEKYSRSIVDAIYSNRPVRTCRQLAEVCIAAYPPNQRYKQSFSLRNKRLHPATKVFMTLRILTNNEFENLKETLPQAIDLLEETGRLAVISFHSGEDRIVKNFFKDQAQRGVLRIITKKPIGPEDEETRKNPRSRSAKIRIAEKI